MNKFRAVLFFFITAINIVVTVACDPEDDTEYPKISVVNPSPNTIYSYGDTIRFQAEISDNNQLSSVELILVDEDNKPMLAHIGLTPSVNPFSFNGEYIIDNPLLPGGIYYLRFRASDGVNVTDHFVKVQIYDLERQMLYPVVVTHPEANKWKVYKLMNDLNWQEIYIHTGDYCGSAVNSAASQFYMCGISQTDLIALRLPDGLQLWHVKPGIHQSGRWFERVMYSNPLLYVSCSDGTIRGYDKTGSELYKTDDYLNSYPGLSVITDNFIIGSYKDGFSNERNLIAFHNQGGLLIHSKFIQSEVIGMQHLVKDKVLLFSNINGNGLVSIYDGSDNTLAELNPFYDGIFYEVSFMDSDNFLVTGSKGIFWYKYSNNSLTPFATSQVFSHIACDITSQLVFATSGKTLKVFSFPFASEDNIFSLPDTTADLHLVYNK